MKPIIHNQSLRRLVASVLFCAITFGVLAYAGAVLTPTRSLLRQDAGSAWWGFLRQPENSLDVVFFGNSHVFDGMDPSVIWKSSGIPGYVMAGPLQSLPITRQYVAEVMRTQNPKVIAIELSTLNYNERNYRSSFQLVNVGSMPWGVNRFRAALIDTPSADRTGALLGLWAYHSRWSQLKPADFDLSKRIPADDFLKGFQVAGTSHPVTMTAEATTIVKPQNPSTMAAEERNLEVLREIARLCERSDAELLLFLTPTAPPGAYSRSLKHAQAELGDEFDNVTFLDLSAPGKVPELIGQTDFIDSGHLATPGAAKASRVMADFLASRGLPDRRDDPAYAAWAEDVKKHDDYVRRKWGNRIP